MKKVIVTVLLASTLLIAGCGGQFATGAATGAAVMAVKEALVERESELQVRHKLALDRYEAALEQTEKDAAAIESARIRKEIDETQTAQTAIETGEVIVKTDWTTPAGAATTAALITNILTALYYRRKDDITLRRG